MASESLTERAGAALAANNGAGGSGRLELGSLYLVDGVPGLGEPLMSTGSYRIGDAGLLDVFDPALEGESGALVGELLEE